MAPIRALITVGNSATLAEARGRVHDLFREICRALPDIMFRYNLDEVITRQELRARIAQEFRRQASSQSPQVVDMQVYKAKEEMMNYLTQSKQRHHVISRWVVGPQGQVPSPARRPLQPGILPRGHESPFLLAFFQGNH